MERWDQQAVLSSSKAPLRWPSDAQGRQQCELGCEKPAATRHACREQREAGLAVRMSQPAGPQASSPVRMKCRTATLQPSMP